MTELALAALLDFLFWWAVLSGTYITLIFTLDWLITTWKQRCENRRALQAQLARIDADRASSVSRLAAVFATAQREIRDASRQQTGFR